MLPGEGTRQMRMPRGETSGAGGGSRPRRRPRRRGEEVRQALIDAAAVLFAERPSGRVHRYFGSKQR